VFPIIAGQPILKWMPAANIPAQIPLHPGAGAPVNQHTLPSTLQEAVFAAAGFHWLSLIQINPENSVPRAYWWRLIPQKWLLHPSSFTWFFSQGTPPPPL
jgi:hypothetical protein